MRISYNLFAPGLKEREYAFVYAVANETEHDRGVGGVCASREYIQLYTLQNKRHKLKAVHLHTTAAGIRFNSENNYLIFSYREKLCKYVLDIFALALVCLSLLAVKLECIVLVVLL